MLIIRIIRGLLSSRRASQDSRVIYDITREARTDRRAMEAVTRAEIAAHGGDAWIEA